MVSMKKREIESGVGGAGGGTEMGFRERMEGWQKNSTLFGAFKEEERAGAEEEENLLLPIRFRESKV